MSLIDGNDRSQSMIGIFMDLRKLFDTVHVLCMCIPVYVCMSVYVCLVNVRGIIICMDIAYLTYIYIYVMYILIHL